MFPCFLARFKLLSSACGILHIASSLTPFIYLFHVSSNLHQGLNFPAVSFVWICLDILGCAGCIGVSWMCVECRGRFFIQTTLKGHGTPVTHTMGWPLPSSSLLTIQDWVKYHFFKDTLSSVPFPDLVFHFLQLMAMLDSLLFSAVNSWKSSPTVPKRCGQGLQSLCLWGIFLLPLVSTDWES